MEAAQVNHQAMAIAWLGPGRRLSDIKLVTCDQRVAG